MSAPDLKLKPRRAATAQSAAGAYGAMQARAVPAQPMAGPAASSNPAPKPRSFLAVNWPLMTAAAALLTGGVAMGMAVGTAPRPQPAIALTATQTPQAPAPSMAPRVAAVPAAREETVPTASSQGWRPISELARVAAEPVPAIDLPKTEATPVPMPEPQPAPVAEAMPSPAAAPAAVAAEPVRTESPAKETARTAAAPMARKAATQSDRPVQLAAAPMAPPSFARPVTGDGAGQAWRARAVAPPAGARPPYVAFLIDDVGLDRKGTQRAVRLPGPVTLSFMSYAAELSEQSAAARAAGHEVMLHLPMEPLDVKRNNPGPHALYVNLDAGELQRRLAWHLDRFSDYVGVNNHMGSRFTADAARMGQVLDELGRRQVFWLDSLTGPGSAGPALARQRGLDAAERDLFLDDERSPGIASELAAMERIARARGDVIAIGHPHAATLTALENWIASAKERGFSLVPVSTVLLRRQQQER
jgi:polysaccharide deacetylase 2 family uncharacterized protein YibQ